MTFTFKCTEKYDKNKIATMLSEGKTGAEIARFYGVSRQRMDQVMRKYELVNPVKDRIRGREAAYKEQQYLRWGDKTQVEWEEKRMKFKNKKSAAQASGVTFELQFHEIIWPTTCPILGCTLEYCSDKRAENSPSFDRIDPAIGYTKENTQIISWRANRIKNDGTSEEHRKIADYLDKITLCISD
jgi:hypothetical protein